ncbi:hypothetical protein KV697_11145 [Sphingomonas sanguinis]|uniref:hypothetical protein n=1 Tax=Sphingomonas sanguinis TaxID=33051 RepID=UPI001C5A1C16|nr:hypothetical protein [Sphingomonas sanguinis]QXT34382.1 hypothetical protein KV697_11145 [Sphingomonas sanguinis]
MLPSFISFAAIIASAQQIPASEFPAEKINQIQTSEITCSSNLSSTLTAGWSPRSGISIKNISVNGRSLNNNLKQQSLLELSEATDLSYIETWCSGSHDIGYRLHFIIKRLGGAARTIMELQVTKGRILHVGVKNDMSGQNN